MPKFAETTSKEQRAAVVAQALALGNRKEAWRRANAGTLTPELGPFDISYTYVCELVQAEEERRDPAATAARGKSAAELADDILRRELRRLDTASRANRLNPVSAREKLRALKELDAIARRSTPSAGPGEDDTGGAQAEPEKPTGILERLAQEEARAMRAAPDDAGSTAGATRDSDANTDHGPTTTPPATNEHATPVRVRAENLAKLKSGV